MGEELELGQLYIQTGDSDYVPFNGIATLDPNDIWAGDEMDEETYNSLVKEGTIVGEMRLTHKQRRKWDKFFRSTLSRLRREKRSICRAKEKARRMKLKHKA